MGLSRVPPPQVCRAGGVGVLLATLADEGAFRARPPAADALRALRESAPRIHLNEALRRAMAAPPETAAPALQLAEEDWRGLSTNPGIWHSALGAPPPGGDPFPLRPGADGPPEHPEGGIKSSAGLPAAVLLTAAVQATLSDSVRVRVAALRAIGAAVRVSAAPWGSATAGMEAALACVADNGQSALERVYLLSRERDTPAVLYAACRVLVLFLALPAGEEALEAMADVSHHVASAAPAARPPSAAAPRPHAAAQPPAPEPEAVTPKP